ncbi:ARM repeat-containing protein [Cryphonectria parasitica EP155]|uniref:ARM repeat-containing protein n=1 Tax=Cryphonectria parasitica (strain ATCC 38755 / EP155) TaxID=660469 RepID=A0A9P4XVN0_CRYP1|nr:ARM repeat-containing protein [Cryphonectria parasitica EP155]KAF3761415.1 ARM repeat-containing protein [Cryphonectria parasitica EP155]
MDRQRLVALLQESQIPDTQRVKAVTAELQKNFYSKPESLLLLIEIVCTHDDTNLRQQAAVQAARLAIKYWEKIPVEQKGSVRQHLVEACMKEQNARCRHSESRLIASIANLDLDEDAWPELIPSLFTLANGGDVSHREVGSYIIYAILEENPTHFAEKVRELLALLSSTIKDPQSRDVRVNTVMSIGAVLMLVEPEEDEAAVSAIQQLIPSMVDVLKDAVESGDDERSKQSFEVFQQFLAYEPILLAPHLRDLMVFMAELAVNTNADADVRCQALAFLAQTVRYRRMKVQAMKDMGAQLTLKSMEILTEIDDDEDEDEITPARAALSLVDQLASDLPPRQVVVPLLDALPKFASSENSGFRKAGVLALGTVAEGAPDFVSTQLKTIMPIVLRLLNDPDSGVRHTALIGLTRIADEMSEELSADRDALVEALLKNIQAASVETADASAAKKNVEILRCACAALDALATGFDSDVMQKYGPELISPVGTLLSHPDFKVKSAAAGALGAIASSMEEAFEPYFEKTMAALGPYVHIKDSEDELDLRSGVCDAMGHFAAAVGPQKFQPYVLDLMKASEEALNLGNPRLRETSFILWASLAKVYGKDFAPFNAGVFKGLFDSLELEEEELVLNLSEEEQAIIGTGEEIIQGGKKIKVRQAEEGEEVAMEADGDEDDEDEWADYGVTPEALEKEVAIEVLGDLVTYACGLPEISQYLQKALEHITPLVEHSYEGCRKAAISTLWRAYARVAELFEEQTGVKWEAGFPPKPSPPELVQLGEIVATATLKMWPDEADRNVVAEINRNVAAVLKTTGPGILAQQNMLEQTVTVLTTLITRSHPSQQDLGDEDEQDVEGTSEYDWVVVDTALDVVIGLGAAMGPAFAELWKVFDKAVMKFGSSQENLERSTAVGVLAEVAAYMGAGVTPYTSSILKLLLKRLTDPDPEVKSNAAYATGQLIYNSTDTNTYLPSYTDILSKLEPMLSIDHARLKDNATGCVCRMIISHPDRVPISDVLPVLVGLLPLKADFEENKPVYECLYKLYEANEPTVQSLTPKLIGVFEEVLSPPEDQLEDETRQVVQRIVQSLFKAKPDLFQGHEQVLKLAGAA